MTLGIALLHYRHWPAVRQAVDAAIGQDSPPDRIVIIDNSSRDGSAERIRSAYPGVQLVQASRNHGYAAGMNIGLELLLRSGLDHVLLLTHDCQLAPDAIKLIHTRLEQEARLGAVGPLLGYKDHPNTVFSAGGFVLRRTWDARHLRTPHRMEEWRGRPPQEVDWLDGSAICLRAAAVRDVGLMDENYFLYFEEADYLIRLKQAGWKVECVPEAKAWQDPHVIPPYLRVRNRLRFISRNAPTSFLWRELVRLGTSAFRDLVFNYSKETRRATLAQFLGLMDFVVGRWGAPPPRMAVPRLRIGPDSDA